MKGSNFTITLCFTLLLFTTAFTKIRKDKDRKKMPSKITGMGDNTNLCTIEGNAAPFHCFCSDGPTTMNATKAKCWIFRGLTQEHNLWTLFATQPLITELNVMVTQVGELTFIPTKGLQYLKDLQSLTIVYGSVGEIQPYAFANLTKVYEMILARNRIVTLSHHAFAHLTNLSVLDLDENRISELSREVFVDLPHLKKLFLKQNNLSVIQEGAFRHLGHLIELELGTNIINVLTKDTFSGLGELKKLILSNNKISMLGDLTFAELWVLEELDLEGNEIEYISDRAFAGLTHLWRLNLSHNKLKTLRGTLLDGVPAIINFDLRHNNLETLTFDNVKPILHNFYNETGYFYIADNNFICDCRLAWVHLLKNKTRNPLILENLDKLTCQMEADDDYQIPAASTKSEADANTLLEDQDPSLDPLNKQPADSEYYEYYEDDYSSLRFLTKIPLKDLPCVEESKPSTQTPTYKHKVPAYAGINFNGCSKNIFSGILLVYVMAILTCIT